MSVSRCRIWWMQDGNRLESMTHPVGSWRVLIIWLIQYSGNDTVTVSGPRLWETGSFRILFLGVLSLGNLSFFIWAVSYYTETTMQERPCIGSLIDGFHSALLFSHSYQDARHESEAIFHPSDQPIHQLNTSWLALTHVELKNCLAKSCPPDPRNHEIR